MPSLALSNLAPLATEIVVRADGLGGRWYQPQMGLGGVANRISRASFERSVPLPAPIVDSLLQFNGVARRIASREPYDCTREGFTLGADPTAQALCVAGCKSITGRNTDDNNDDGVLALAKRARTWARAYGGGAIVLLVDDGRESTEPIDEQNIRRIIGARVVTRWELYPAVLETRSGSPRVGKPRIYQVVGTSGLYVHHSRVIVFQGLDLPDLVMQRQQGWGGSVFDLLWPALRNYQIVMELLPEMASRLNQGVYEMADLQAGVGADLKTQIVDRLEAQEAGVGVMGSIVIGKGERYETLMRPVSGVNEIVGALQLDLVANADEMPKLLLYGETPGGLRSGDNPEVTAWYDTCSGRQRHHFTAPIKRMLRLLAAAKEGPTRGVVPAIEIEWLPLYQSSQSEIDASEKSRADRRAVDINAAVVSPTEARTDPDVARLYTIADDTAAATPGVEPDAGAPELAAAASPADEALNGAQGDMLLGVFEKLKAGTITYVNAFGAIGLMFPKMRGREAELLGPEPVVTTEADAAPSPGTPPSDPASPQEAAAKWGVPTLTITRLIRAGTLPHWRIGSRTIVSLSEVGLLAKAHEAEIAAE